MLDFHGFSIFSIFRDVKILDFHGFSIARLNYIGTAACSCFLPDVVLTGSVEDVAFGECSKPFSATPNMLGSDAATYSYPPSFF